MCTSSVVQFGKQKLLGINCLHARSIHTLKIINRTVICSCVESGTVIFTRTKYKKVRLQQLHTKINIFFGLQFRLRVCLCLPNIKIVIRISELKFVP